MLRAFTLNMSKYITFKISKHYFIYINTPLYNTPNIKSFIFFTTSLKYYLFVIYNSFFFFSMRHLFLSFSVCLSSPSKNNQPTLHGHCQPPPTQCHHPHPQPRPQHPVIHGHMAQLMASTHDITHNKPLEPTTKSINPHTTQSHPNQLTPRPGKTSQGCRNPPTSQTQFYDPDLINPHPQNPQNKSQTPPQPKPSTTHKTHNPTHKHHKSQTHLTNHILMVTNRER